MDQNTLRLLLLAFAFYTILKTAAAPKRGSFLTLFGNIGRHTQPQAFRACSIAGYALAAVMLLAALFSDAWFGVLMRQ